jgi:hypothetical protein
VKDPAVLEDIEKVRKRVKKIDKDFSRKPPDP